MTGLPLRGVRIADFSWSLAGPYCAMLLALAGADVVKVESLRKRDLMRWLDTPDPRDANKGRKFPHFNLAKRSLRLDLSRPEGVAVAKRLIRKADAVIENFRPGTMDRLGLGYAAVSLERPDLVMVSVSGLGQTGPERRYATYASVFGALGGLSYITGYPDGEPTEIRSSLDLRAGASAAFATMAALLHRRRTGRGQHVDVSACDSVTCAIGEVVMDYVMNQRVCEHIGNGHEWMAPHGVYRCAGEDRWLSIAVGDDAEWAGLCATTGHAEWRDDPRFADAAARYAHRDELDRLIETWTRERDPLEATRLLQAHGVPAAPSATNRDLYEDGHLAERGLWVEGSRSSMRCSAA